MFDHARLFVLRPQNCFFLLEGTVCCLFVASAISIDKIFLPRIVLAVVCIGCEPGEVGAMSTGASPLDPIFWTLHGLFEKVNKPPGDR